MGYTIGMKTAISLPEGVFKEAEKFAHKMKKSRSQLYSEAITEYLARHAPNDITEAMNAVCEKMGNIDTKFTRTSAKKLLSKEKW